MTYDLQNFINKISTIVQETPGAVCNNISSCNFKITNYNETTYYDSFIIYQNIILFPYF